MRVLILGAGGHAEVVADILLCMQENGEEIELAGYLDDNVALIGQKLLRRPVLGRIKDLRSVAHDALMIAIGDNEARRKLYLELRDRGEEFIVARHPKSTVAGDVELGPGTMICAGVVVNPGSSIGANVILNTSCSVDHHCRIGSHSHIGPGAHVGGEVVVGEASLIGIGAVVLPGTSIGTECIVGAGAVVNRNVSDRLTVVGIPARRPHDKRG